MKNRGNKIPQRSAAPFKKGELKSATSYDPSEIESKWQKKWAKDRIYLSKEDPKKKKYYVLDMFPYPSGEGLHVGHPKGYIATDIVSRMKRMQGYSVLHPMGFDAFGLPAENYAIKQKINPAIAVAKNVEHFKKQLEILGFDYDWSREVNTTDPKFYKWTQWIFLQLFKKGLAYESYEPINWCPSCKTGLANEDVENGRCERCGTPVEKKPMRQWMLKITDYAERLLKDLDLKALPNGDLFETLPNGEPGIVHMNDDVPGKVRLDKPFVPRDAICAFVEHWSDDVFIILKWKKVDWMTPITGGIEKGQTPEQAALAEINEETGFKNLILVNKTPGNYHSTFFHPPKDENRIGHFTAFHFKLKDGTKDEVAFDEQSKHEVTWVPRARVRDILTAEGSKLGWDLVMKGKVCHETKTLLDWPESIKTLQRNWIGKKEGAEIDFPIKQDGPKPRFVLLHGFTGSAKRNFFPWLKSELEKRGYEVEAPELPDTKSPTEEGQVGYVLENCKLDENTILLGHSLGGVVAMKALMKLDKAIRGLVLVAPALDPKYRHDKSDKKFHATFTWDYDFEKIKNLAQTISILSDLQEKHRVEYLKFLTQKLSANLIETVAKKEHYCAEEEPDVLNALIPTVRVFTTRPDTLFGVTYVVLAPEHKLASELIKSISNRPEVEAYITRAKGETEIQRTDGTKNKTGVELKGLKVINPANNEEVPIWIADYVLADYGTGAVMAVPAHDERDADFAKKYNLPIREIKLEDKEEMTKKFGQKVIKYKLHDWVFSRQRYWGEPIPVIHCPKCGIVAVPEKDLPVRLPKVESYEPTGTGESPLAAIDSWVNVKCPVCKTLAKRETNTMPQWAGSSWYYLRYEDPLNDKKLVDSKKEKYWSPVDLYVGGAEHATRHLIYARFWHKFLYDIGVVSAMEPFMRLQHVGLIMGEDGKKMSKRSGNVVNPDDIVKTYGADTLRVYEMFMGPFDQQIAWNTSSIIGARRFIERVWKLKTRVSETAKGVGLLKGRELSERSDAIKASDKEEVTQANFAGPEKVATTEAVSRLIHKTITKVTADIENLRFNTAISSLMIAVNEIEKAGAINAEQYGTLLKLIAPFAPHVAEELWTSLGNRKSIHISEWPSSGVEPVRDEEATIVVQINGKVRGSFKAAVDSTEEALKTQALSLPETTRWTEGKEITKVIVIKGRLVSVVVA